jgi:hypothetical protein
MEHARVLASQTDATDASKELQLDLLDVRIFLHLTDLEKHGVEGRSYNSLGDISKVFIDGVNSCSTKTITAPDWMVPADATNQSEPASVVGKVEGVNASPTVEEMSDPVYMAGVKGLKLDALVVARKTKADDSTKETEAVVYKITKIAPGDDGIELVQQTIYDTRSTVKTTLLKLISDFNVYKGNIPIMLAADWADAYNPEMNEQWAIDCQKGRLGISLRELEGRFRSNYNGLRLYINPKCVRACMNFKIGALVLVPSTFSINVLPLGKAVAATSVALCNASPPVVIKPCTFAASSMSQIPKEDDDTKTPKKQYVVPYWWVIEKPADAANMGVALMKSMQTGMEIPVLVNTKPLQRFDVLAYHGSRSEPQVTLRGECLDGKPPNKRPRGVRA